MQRKNYYQILRVARGATAEEIRSAYRRRAMEIHPDVSGSTSEPFLELQEAYSVLNDPSQRAAYDSEGHRVKIRPSQPGHRPSSAREPLGGVEFADDFGAMDDLFKSFDEFFNQMRRSFFG